MTTLAIESIQEDQALAKTDQLLCPECGADLSRVPIDFDASFNQVIDCACGYTKHL